MQRRAIFGLDSGVCGKGAVVVNEEKSLYVPAPRVWQESQSGVIQVLSRASSRRLLCEWQRCASFALESGVCEKNGVGDDDELRSNPPAPPGLNLTSDVYEGARVQKKRCFGFSHSAQLQKRFKPGARGHKGFVIHSQRPPFFSQTPDSLDVPSSGITPTFPRELHEYKKPLPELALDTFSNHCGDLCGMRVALPSVACFRRCTGPPGGSQRRVFFANRKRPFNNTTGPRGRDCLRV